MSIRQTVGGAQNVVTRCSTMRSSRSFALPVVTLRTVASALSGTKNELHACFAQPGADTFRCTSPGRTPFQYMPDRCPTG